MLIVLAGYTKEMDAMLDSNPGLRSRFPYRYQFDDYDAAQLMEIARHLLEKEEFRSIKVNGGKYRISKKSFDDWLDKGPSKGPSL